MIVGRMDYWKRHLSGGIWRTAFEALKHLHGATQDGETKLLGDDLLYRVQTYATRTDPMEGILETHKEFIDIQTTLAGSERIEWFPAETLQIKTPYDLKKEAQFYHRPPGPAPAAIDVFPGTFVVLFPEDAHMAQLITPKGDKEVKKVVVKVRLSKI